jgi:hypothetical protein
LRITCNRVIFIDRARQPDRPWRLPEGSRSGAIFRALGRRRGAIKMTAAKPRLARTSMGHRHPYGPRSRRLASAEARRESAKAALYHHSSRQGPRFRAVRTADNIS